MKSNLNKFIKDGFISFNELLNKKKCKIIYNKLKNNRNWGKSLFQSKKEFLNEFKNKKKRTTTLTSIACATRFAGRKRYI